MFDYDSEALAQLQEYIYIYVINFLIKFNFFKNRVN